MVKTTVWVLLLAAVLESIAVSGMIYFAHGLPLNEKYIEPAMMQHKKWAYAAGFGYYAFAAFLPTILIHFLLLHDK